MSCSKALLVMFFTCSISNFSFWKLLSSDDGSEKLGSRVKNSLGQEETCFGFACCIRVYLVFFFADFSVGDGTERDTDTFVLHPHAVNYHL